MILVEKDGVTMGVADESLLDAFLSEGWKPKDKKKQKPNPEPKADPKPKAEKKTTAKPSTKRSGKAKKEQ